MVLTTAKLMKEFNASVGYTQSDEITLVLMPKKFKDKDEY
jgi:tRNA(His) 5'-end guanylyltransferase